MITETIFITVKTTTGHTYRKSFDVHTDGSANAITDEVRSIVRSEWNWQLVHSYSWSY